MDNEKKEKNLSLRGLNKKVEEFMDETRETNRQVLELLKEQSVPKADVTTVTEGDVLVNTNKETVVIAPSEQKFELQQLNNANADASRRLANGWESKYINHAETLKYNPKPMLQQEYQRIFEEYFDINDGFEAEMDFSDKISFTILVPQKLSNASAAHWTYYKYDKRMVALPQGNISGGIKAWCEKVCKNLHYNKDDVRK